MHGLNVMGASQAIPTMADQLTVRIDDDLEQQMDHYRVQFDFPPNKSEVVRKALTEFFERELDN